ncbi:MAG: hypothetical protein J6X22_09745 [Muribaculaceae bacterium]|nr:hypothetical protein [Muribaculaceae bacterium]
MKTKVLSIFFIATVLCCAPMAQAQDYDSNDEPKNELAVGYGAVNSSSVLDVFVDVVSAMFGARYQNKSFVGPFSAEYFYHVSPLVGVGGIGVYNHHSQDVLQDEEVTGKRKSNYFTIMPAVKFNWLRKQHWGMYSKLGAGYTHGEFTTTGKDSNGAFTKENVGNDFFNFQVSLVGVEAGNRNVRGFAELGFGEQGFVHGGLRFRF